MEKMILAIVNPKGKREFNSLSKEFKKDLWIDFGGNTFMKFLSTDTDENKYIEKVKEYKFSHSIKIIPLTKEQYKNISMVFSNENNK